MSRERNMITYKNLWCKTEIEHYLAGQEIPTFDRSSKVITMLVIVIGSCYETVVSILFLEYVLFLGTLKKICSL